MARQFINDIHQVAIEKGYKRILLDLTQWQEPDSEMTRFWSGTYLAELFGYSGIKIAAFALAEFITGFGETAAINRGAFFRIFPEESLAIQWLLGKSTNAAPK